MDLALVGPNLLEGQNDQRQSECGLMKEDLVARSRRGNGLVPLAKFWSQEEKKRTAMFGYDETMEHLRDIGALDETSGRHPQVRIPNYMLAPLNCGLYSSTMTRCCLNECELIIRNIEHQVRAPMAAPEDLISLVGNMSTSSVDTPRRLPTGLAQRLHAIAAKRSGMVPLHGRLFAEWLHLAFPNECPCPHSFEDGTMRSVSHWRSADVEGLQVLSAADKAEQQRRINASEDELHVGPEDFGARPWMEEETLHMPRNRGGSLLSVAARVLLFFAMGVALLRVAQTSVQEGTCSAQGPKLM